jgi:hypothetical protein
LVLATLGRNLRIAALIALIGVALASASVPARAGSDDGCRPRGAFRYSRDRITATYSVDLQKCWRWKKGARYEIHARIDRVEGGSPLIPLPGESKDDDFPCSFERICRVKLTMPHPDAELAYYQFEITYEHSPRQVEHQTFSWRCTSNPLYSKCDTSVPLPLR